MIATQDSAAHGLFGRTLETARRRLRETIEKHPDTLAAEAEPWRRGFFPGMLWILSELGPDATWWANQAIHYSKPLAGVRGDGVGFALLPSVCRWAAATHDPEAAQIVGQAAREFIPRLEHQDPTVSTLMDAILLFHASAISGDSDMRAAGSAHCLAARRLLVRGDGSLAIHSDSARDLSLAIYGFGAACQFTRDPRFLGAAESCAAYFLETLPVTGLPEDASAGAIAASALLQLASLAADSAKARFYSLTARQILNFLGDHRLEDAEGEYFLLDAVNKSAISHDDKLPVVPALNGVHKAPAPPLAEPAPVTQPEPEPAPEPVPEKEVTGRRPVRTVTFLLAPIVFYLLVELLVFRSNFYTRFIEPESSAGTFEGAYEHESTRPRVRDKEVIILGSSRIAEGFSAKRANQLEPKDGYWFVNGAVSGAGPRCMYYMVRDIDPRRNRYKAMVMTIDDYADPDDYEDLADRAEDLYSVIARLRYSDILTFMRSFTTHASKMEVLRGGLLKSIVYQRDLQEFLDHPSDRLDKVNLYRGHRYDWAYDYGGSEHSLAGTTIDWSTNTITFPPNIPKDEQDYLRPRMMITAPQKARNRAFQVRWLGAIADLYRDSKTRLIFIQPPRTGLPRPVPLHRLNWTTVDDLAKRPWVTVVDPNTFENLERPEYFSDHAHLNSEGQKLFSPALASAVECILERGTR